MIKDKNIKFRMVIHNYTIIVSWVVPKSMLNFFHDFVFVVSAKN